MSIEECLAIHEEETLNPQGEQQIDIIHLLELMVEREASDLHLRAGSPPIIRLDGVLVPVEDMPPLTPEATRKAFKRISTEGQRAILYRERELDFSYSIDEQTRFRVNAFFQRGTVGLSIRWVPCRIPAIDELGIPPVCKTLALKPRGLVLVTGPSGSGKSTTLAAMINYINKHQTRNVITIEDPIEFLHHSENSIIAQRELGDDTISFAMALRQALRQDTDVIMVGEMRDLDTIAATLTAAETGRLVLSTLHTPDAPQTIERIVNTFPPSQQQQARLQLSMVLEAVISQTLLPRADGQGRVVACEVMMATDAIRNLIRESKTYQTYTYLQTGQNHGMQSIEQALRQLVASGKITEEEASKRINRPGELNPSLNSRLGRSL